MIHWNSFADFLAMGGYAGYVWGSFGATALILILEPLFIIRRRKETISRLKRQMRAELASSSRNSVE
ncbi:MAG: heme exporter protein [Rhodocyclaceae bacterium]|nr:heme exporter protein [Rhodocyclaceae bacterium]